MLKSMEQVAPAKAELNAVEKGQFRPSKDRQRAKARARSRYNARERARAEKARLEKDDLDMNDTGAGAPVEQIFWQLVLLNGRYAVRVCKEPYDKGTCTITLLINCSTQN